MFNPADEVSSINFSSIIGGALNAVVDAQKESAATTVNFVKEVGFKPGPIDSQTGEEVGSGEPICVKFSYDKEVSPSQVQQTKKVYAVIDNSGEGYNSNQEVEFSIDSNILTDVEYSIENGGIKTISFKTVPQESYIYDGATIIACQKAESDAQQDNISAKITLKVEEIQTAIPALYQKMEIEVPVLTMMPIPFIKIATTDIEFNVKINSVSNSASSSNKNFNLTNNTNATFKFWRNKVNTTLNTSISNQKSTSNSEKVTKDYSLNVKIHAVQDDMPAGMSKILDILEDSIVTKTVAQPSQQQN